MLKNIQAKASDNRKAAQDLKITIPSVVEAILKLGHEEEASNGGGMICSVAKIRAFFIENDSKADATTIGLQLKKVFQLGVEEGAFHRPEKFAANKIDMRGSFVVPHNNNKVVEPATIPTIGKPPNLRAVQQKQKSGRKNPNNASPSSGVPLVASAGDFKRFVRAARKGDLRTLQHLHYKFNGMIANCFHKEKTALHEACRFGHKAVIEWLLDVAKADVELPDESTEGFRAIHWAANVNRNEVLELLIQKRAQLNSRSKLSERTALYIAITAESTECFQTLIQGGCDINVEDESGLTPFHCAIYSKNDFYVDKLIASKRLLIDWKKKTQGRNLLHHAVSEDNLRVVQWILKNCVTANDLLMETTLLNGSTALHLACNKKNFQIAKLIADYLKASAIPNALSILMEVKDRQDMTALMVSIFHLDYPTIELLVESGADLKATNYGHTSIPLYYPLTHAEKESQVPSIESSPGIFKKMEYYPTQPLLAYLIEKGMSWESKNQKGETAADILLQQKCPKNVIDSLNVLYLKTQISIYVERLSSLVTSAS